MTFVDASFAVHDNMRGHTGLVLTFRIGVFMSESKTQYLNTKISTECELVLARSSLPKALRIHLFLYAQGYPLTNNLFFQENGSTIKLKINGPSSSNKRTRQVNIRYFYIKDPVDKKTITVKQCPTISMFEAFFAKPLQGKFFDVYEILFSGRGPFQI